MTTGFDHDSPFDGTNNRESAEVIKIKLEVVVHHTARWLVEWKVVGIKGDPPRMVALLEAGERELDPTSSSAAMGAQIKSLLEEYCEPF